MNFIFIEQELIHATTGEHMGSETVEYRVDTEEEIEAAKEALRNAGLTEAWVYNGSDEENYNKTFMKIVV